LLSGFRKTFIIRLMITVFVVCFVGVFLFSTFYGGGIKL
jgi:hypothetical protein